MKPDPQTPAAVIYARISTGAQEENTSIPNQIKVGLKKAEDMGVPVHAIHQDTASGALYLSRGGIQAALADIEAGKAKYLITMRLDRQGRDVDVLRKIRQRVESAGGEMIFADGFQFPKGAIGRFLHTSVAGVSELERDLIAERMETGRINKIESGEQIARTLSPYGYYVPIKADIIRGDYKPEQLGKYIVVEEQAAIVREIYRLYASGLSLRRVAAVLQDKGIPTPRGKQYWTAVALRFMMQNPIYKGHPAYGKSKRFVDESREQRGLRRYYLRPRPESEWRHMTGPAVVDANLWQQANNRLKTARETFSGRTDRKYMLSGLLRCPFCSGTMYVRSYGRNKILPRGEEYSASYICANAIPSLKKIGYQGERCQCRYYYSKPLERLVIDALLHVLDHPNVIKDAQSAYNTQRAMDATVNEVKRQREALRKQLDAISKRETAAAESKVEAKVSGGSVAVFDRMLSELAEKRKKLNEQMRAIKEPKVTIPDFRIPRDSRAAIRSALTHPATSGADKHEAVKSIVDRVYPCHPRKRIAGVKIVLRTGRDTPVYVITNIQELKRSADGSVDDVEPGIRFEILERDPFPARANREYHP